MLQPFEDIDISIMHTVSMHWNTSNDKDIKI